jgi:putative oxidoreductase
MAGHGLQKLTGSFGGGGPEGTGEAFEKMGIEPGKYMAMATGAAETAGGAMMALGLGTPYACAMVTGVMTGAIAKVHLKHGFWTQNSGFEYNLGILASTFAIAGAGGGAMTLDGLRGKKHRGFGWAMAQLVVGAGAALGVLAATERQGTGLDFSSGTAAGAGSTDQNNASSNGPDDSAGTLDLSRQGQGAEHLGTASVN